MSDWMQRLRLRLGRWCVEPYGYSVVLTTPASLLPSRVEALRETVAKSGHLGHRYHVRRTLGRQIADVENLVARL